MSKVIDGIEIFKNEYGVYQYIFYRGPQGFTGAAKTQEEALAIAKSDQKQLRETGHLSDYEFQYPAWPAERNG